MYNYACMCNVSFWKSQYFHRKKAWWPNYIVHHFLFPPLTLARCLYVLYIIIDIHKLTMFFFAIMLELYVLKVWSIITYIPCICAIQHSTWFLFYQRFLFIHGINVANNHYGTLGNYMLSSTHFTPIIIMITTAIILCYEKDWVIHILLDTNVLLLSKQRIAVLKTIYRY